MILFWKTNPLSSIRSLLQVSESRDFCYLNYAQESSAMAVGLVGGTSRKRYTFITANLLQGLNIIGKIQNMTSALKRLNKVRSAMSSIEGGSHLTNMVSAYVKFCP